MRYNQEHYTKVFGDEPEIYNAIKASEEEPSLQNLVSCWLERTPGLEERGFNFWEKYKRAVDSILDEQLREAEVSYHLSPCLNRTDDVQVSSNCQIFIG